MCVSISRSDRVCECASVLMHECEVLKCVDIRTYVCVCVCVCVCV